MRKFFVLTFLLLIVATTASAQILQPVPTLHYIDAGYGAAALGMGGAFVAVANDLSAIYWNPAGLGQLPGLQLYLDYRHQGDSDEDFAPTVFPNGSTSRQRFSLSGNQIQALSASYAFRKPGFTIVPAFAYQRLSIFSPTRNLKESAQSQTSFISQNSTLSGLFQEEINKGEDEFAFAVGATITRKVFVGGSWSFLRGKPEEIVTGNFQTSSAIPGEQILFTTTARQETINDYTGNYLKVGVLAFPSPLLSLGGTVRFPYTRKNTFTIHTTGPFTRVETFFDPNGNVDHVVTTNGDLNEPGGGASELNVPLEFSAGASIRPAVNYLISGSITRADWSDARETVPDVNYPSFQDLADKQASLLQWRVGFQYTIGEVGNGIALRTGYFLDRQPFGTSDEQTYLKGFSVGAGYVSRGLHFDFAYVRENGDFTLTPASVGSSHVSNRRWIFSFAFSGE